MRTAVKYSKTPKVRDSSRVLHDIEFRPGYGVIAPSRFTTNGNSAVIRENIKEDDVPDFDAWVSSLGV
jgi:hypothetical protein